MSGFSSWSHDFSKPDLWLCDACGQPYCTGNTLEQNSFRESIAGVLPISTAWGTKLPEPWEPKSKAKSRRESVNAGSPPTLRSPVFASKQPMCFRKVTWDLMKLEIQQEPLLSACKSTGPYGTAHLCSAGRSCWPRRILFLAQSASAVRWQGWEDSRL